MLKIGIIGGTGLENPKFLKNLQDVYFETPYGKHSDILEGLINDIPCVLLLRHGKLHQLSPSNINYRANIWALKKLGNFKIYKNWDRKGSFFNQLVFPVWVIYLS